VRKWMMALLGGLIVGLLIGFAKDVLRSHSLVNAAEIRPASTRSVTSVAPPGGIVDASYNPAMEGDEAVERVAGLQPADVLEAIAPGTRHEQVAFLAARPLPGGYRFAVFACLSVNGTDPETTVRLRHGEPQCWLGLSKLSHRAMHVVIGILEKSATGILRTVAHTEWETNKPGPLDIIWDEGTVQPLLGVATSARPRVEILSPDLIAEFDSRNYAVSPGVDVIALRSEFWRPTDPLFGMREFLTLFKVEGNRVVPIFHEFIHRPDDGKAAVVKVLPSMPQYGGYKDIEIVVPTGHIRKRLRWGASCGCYQDART